MGALRIQSIFTIPESCPYMEIGRAFSPRSGGLRSDRMKLVLLLALVVGLAACNTVAGVGEDVSGGARQVQNWIN